VTLHVINSEQTLQTFIGDVREQWKRFKYLRVRVRTGRDRSLDQNAIGHVWYEQVANELREDNALGVKRFCKLHFGVPILRAEDESFREIYDRSIKDTLTYEQKLKAMDILDVTSIMTVPQHSAYLVAMQDHYCGVGVQLEFPEKPQRPSRKKAA
jgi:hypothetical protein